MKHEISPSAIGGHPFPKLFFTSRESDMPPPHPRPSPVYTIGKMQLFGCTTDIRVCHIFCEEIINFIGKCNQPSMFDPHTAYVVNLKG